ncbi:hypothetical protein D3C72_2273670 [compost metagenome]
MCCLLATSVRHGNQDGDDAGEHPAVIDQAHADAEDERHGLFQLTSAARVCSVVPSFIVTAMNGPVLV